MYKILRREAFSDVTFLWDVEAPDVAAAAQPGHFVMVRLRDGGERVPLTVADFDRNTAVPCAFWTAACTWTSIASPVLHQKQTWPSFAANST